MRRRLVKVFPNTTQVPQMISNIPRHIDDLVISSHLAVEDNT